jgi:hypothetical protein
MPKNDLVGSKVKSSMFWRMKAHVLRGQVRTSVPHEQ